MPPAPISWICIYPAYLNSKKSRQEGRRLPKQHCVENPTFQEIKDVLTVTKLNIGVENKLYPREKSKELLHRGRIRIQLKTDNGLPVNADFPTRDSVLLHLGTMIPQLKTRQGSRASSVPDAGQLAAQQQAQAGGSGAGGAKKGGKGGKKR